MGAGMEPRFKHMLCLLNACSLPLSHPPLHEHFLTAFSLLSPFLSGRARVPLCGHLREEPHCFTSVPWLSFLSPQSRQRARNTAAASVTGTACSCPRRLPNTGNASLTCAEWLVVTHFRRSPAEVFSRLSALWRTMLPSIRPYFLFLSPFTNAVFCPLNLELSTRHGCDHTAPLTSAI